MVFMELNDDRSEKIRYDYADYPISIRRELLSAYPNYTAPTHWHDDIEFIMILSGEMQYNVNGRISTLKENEGIIVNTRQLHFGFSAERKECDFICILLHPLMLCATAAYEREFVLPVLRNPNAAFIKLHAGVSWKKELADYIRCMYAVRDGELAPLKVQSLFMRAWILLCENVSLESCPQIQNTDLSLLKNMIGFIQQNYTVKITLSDIAASAAVGQSKCCRLFAKYTGQTPNRYLMHYRLNKSMELLENTDMTVTEIAEASGFGGGSYYAEAFRRWAGKSPSEYRKRMRRDL